MGIYYGSPDNASPESPVWPALGFPGPVTPPPTAEQAPKTIRVEELDGPVRDAAGRRGRGRLRAGGGVIAAELQAAGLQVVVLERAGYRNEQDFLQLEAVAAQELYLRGGLWWSESGSIGILAGATLGGGTVINSMVCLRPPAEIRAAWAAAGLEGLDGRGVRRPPRRRLRADRREHRAHDPEPRQRADGRGARGARPLLGEAAAERLGG